MGRRILGWWVLSHGRRSNLGLRGDARQTNDLSYRSIYDRRTVNNAASSDRARPLQVSTTLDDSRRVSQWGDLGLDELRCLVDLFIIQILVTGLLSEALEDPLQPGGSQLELTFQSG